MTPLTVQTAAYLLLPHVSLLGSGRFAVGSAWLFPGWQRLRSDWQIASSGWRGLHE
jgi:hypothetical protein